MKHLSRDLLTAIGAALIAVGGELENPELILFTNDIELDEDTVVGDLTQPTFTGYAAKAVTLAAGADENGEPVLHGAPVAFSPTNATNLPQAIVGAAIINAGGDLMACGKFASPIGLTAALQSLVVVPKLDIDSQQGSTFSAVLG